MKTKTVNKKFYVILMTVIMLLAAAFTLGFSTMTAEASTYSSNKCKTYGTYSTGGDYTSGCPSNFSIYMHSSSYSSSVQTINNDRVLNWNYVYIKIEVSALSNHKTFQLTRNGNLYSSKSLSGADNQTLYSGSLPDGNYELTYVGNHKPHWYSGTTTYTYKYRFVIDKTPPSYTMKAGASTIYSGGYTNQQITYSVTDNLRTWCIYYKRPGYTSYNISYSTNYTVPTTATNGWYYFYAEDYYYNTNSTVSVYLDTVKPVGTVKASNGNSVSNGGYTNKSFSYTATDVGGVKEYMIKRPGTTAWSSYTAGTSISGSYGWYYFRCVDRAGNYSDEYKVYYDAAAPVGVLYGGTTSKSSGTYTNASYVKYTASDSYSGIANCYVRMPNSTYYTSYASGTQLSTEGTYSFYSVDRSGNQSSTVSITLDKTKPTGTLYGGTTAINSGGHSNASYIKYVPYDAIGIANNYVMKPGSSSYVSYTAGTQLTTEGVYRFYSVDRAGNASQTYTLTLSRQVPKAQLYVDEKPFDNYGYTNGQFIKFESPANNCYVKLPGSDNFIMYVSGTEFYKSGKYIFYGTDLAGNSTGYYSIVIDRTNKPVDFLNVTDGITDGDVIIDWADGDPDVFAPIADIEVNGKKYVKGAVIHTIDTGRYLVKTTDAAGNVWESEFASTKDNIPTKTFQKKYYEAYDNDGNLFTFASFESALAFGASEERKFVSTGEWNNEVWDIGMPMDAKDSVNAANGTYFVYKKSGSANEEIAYFTDERLSEVINEYAAVRISEYFYWEKEHAPIADGENLFSYSDGKVILANAIELGEHIGCLIDGEEFIGSLITTEGKHVLTVLDDWGNSCDYDVYIVRRAADIRYAIGEGISNLAAFDRVYYFKDAVTVMIEDEIDEFAMFNVFDENGALLAKLGLDETYTIAESGTYTVQAINHYGLSESFMFVISRDAPKIVMMPDVEAKKLEIGITESIDKETQIRTLEIYKSIDDGETWEQLSKDDYGTIISLDTLSYEFRTSGRYKVVISDEFRTGIDAVTMEIDYAQPKPYAELCGVENGGYTNGEVSFIWTDEANVIIEHDGAVLLYRSGGTFTEDGKYEITFSNFDGYEKVFTFTIDTVKPDVEIDGAQDATSVNCNVAVTWEEENLTAKVYKNDELEGDYVSGTVITEDGSYKVVVADLAQNERVVEFVIDKTVDYTINVNEKGLSNSVTVVANEDLSATLLHNGEQSEFDFANPITIPGKYVLTLNDELGNSVTKEFEIVKPLGQSFMYNFDDMPDFEKAVVNGEDRRLNYGTLELTEDGTYIVGVVAGGKTYEFTVTVDASAPVILLNGVANGETTNGTVKVSWNDADVTKVVCRFGGKEISVENGTEFTEEGTYEIAAEDLCANKSSVRFHIDKTLEYTVVVNGEAVDAVNARLNKNITFVNKEPLKASVFLDGEAEFFEFGQILKNEGTYEVRIYDDYGNLDTICFVIDKTAPEIVLKGVEKGGATKNPVALENPSEPCDVKVYLNGEEIEYTIGDELTEVGEYRVELTDAVGNDSEFDFTIQKKMSGGLIALFVILGIGVAGGGVFAFLFVRKRRRH